MKYIYFQRIRLLKNKIAAELRIFKKKKGSTPQEYRMFLQQMLIKY